MFIQYPTFLKIGEIHTGCINSLVILILFSHRCLQMSLPLVIKQEQNKNIISELITYKQQNIVVGIVINPSDNTRKCHYLSAKSVFLPGVLAPNSFKRSFSCCTVIALSSLVVKSTGNIFCNIFSRLFRRCHR